MLNIVEDIYPTSQEVLIEDLGIRLWRSLEELNKKYSESVMQDVLPETSFDDDYWNSLGSSRYDFKWDVWLPNEQHYPLKLLCKIAAYVTIFIQGQTPSTVQPKIIGFINLYLPTLTDKNILVSNRNTPFKSLIDLTSNDISIIAQNSLLKDSKLGSAPFIGLDLIAKLTASELFDVSFLTLGVSTPWGDADIAVGDYANSLKHSFGINTETKPYPSFTFDTVSNIVTQAMIIINAYHDIIIDIFDIVEKSNQSSPNKKIRVSKSASAEIYKRHGNKINRLLPITFGKNEPYISQTWYSDLQWLTQSACAWIVLLTTGLRNIDLRNLTHDCCVKSKRSDLVYYLVTDIRKSHLNKYILPVPEQTNKAILLAQKAKIYRDGNIIFHKKTIQNKNKNKNKVGTDPHKMDEEATFNHFLMRFGEFFDFEIETISTVKGDASCHCGRATLAGFIGANSSAAILILKRLFGHSNGLMPDAYLLHNPLVIAERNKAIVHAQEKLAGTMAKAITDKKVSGTKGKQLLKGAESIKAELQREFSANSITQMDMQVTLTERLRELLLSRMTENQIFAMLTPLSVVCLRSCSDTTDSPCAKQANEVERRNKYVSKALTDALATLPNPAHCVGKSCSDALIGDPWSRNLLETFDFHVQYLKSSQGNYNLEEEAKCFVNAYAEIMKELYENERQEGYFDKSYTV
jgi:hypothetical protein